MKRIISIVLSLLIFSSHGFSFCGFYVAKADTKLFNKTSEVIYVRNGNKSTITMSNDFQGDVKDFAMVVPVPTVLDRKDIRTMDRALFKKFDAYSGPRLVEYHDPDPCPRQWDEIEYSLEDNISLNEVSMENVRPRTLSRKSVKIEARYQVGEYDILILSAKKSSGLKDWLIENDYKIPEGAEEVLDPYIKDNMKFFVVKVNLDRLNAQSGDNLLNPIQITFESPKFMLPIRLGMANANGAQDMIVYFLSKKGRIETANYRTAKIPTDRKVPLFVRNEFGKVYKNTFDNAWEDEGKDAVMLEYAWDVSSNTAVKCDPCVGPPPLFADFMEAGVDWFKNTNQRQERWDGSGGDYGSAFFTRLHVRYDRAHFPQDLLFVETPNKENFQGRYVLNNPARGQFDCDEAQAYLESLYNRRNIELFNLYDMASWDKGQHKSYLDSAPLSAEINKRFEQKGNSKKGGSPLLISPTIPGGNGGGWSLFLTAIGLLVIAYLFFKIQESKKRKQLA